MLRDFQVLKWNSIKLASNFYETISIKLTALIFVGGLDEAEEEMYVSMVLISHPRKHFDAKQNSFQAGGC